MKTKTTMRMRKRMTTTMTMTDGSGSGQGALLEEGGLGRSRAAEGGRGEVRAAPDDAGFSACQTEQVLDLLGKDPFAFHP